MALPLYGPCRVWSSTWNGFQKDPFPAFLACCCFSIYCLEIRYFYFSNGIFSGIRIFLSPVSTRCVTIRAAKYFCAHRCIYLINRVQILDIVSRYLIISIKIVNVIRKWKIFIMEERFRWKI